MDNPETTASSTGEHRDAWKKVADIREHMEGSEAFERRMRGFILANPGQAIALSLGVGFLLGFVVLRRR